VDLSVLLKLVCLGFRMCFVAGVGWLALISGLSTPWFSYVVSAGSFLVMDTSFQFYKILSWNVCGLNSGVKKENIRHSTPHIGLIWGVYRK
jgi:hypothetical protein